jgi:hypothetical protein
LSGTIRGRRAASLLFLVAFNAPTFLQLHADDGRVALFAARPTTAISLPVSLAPASVGRMPGPPLAPAPGPLCAGASDAKVIASASAVAATNLNLIICPSSSVWSAR